MGENTAFYGQVGPNVGQDENGVVSEHPGLLPSGSGGIVDQPEFANADFSQGNYVVGRVTVRLVNDNSPSSFTSVSTNDDDDNSTNDDNNDDDDSNTNDDNNDDDDDSNTNSSSSSD